MISENERELLMKQLAEAVELIRNNPDSDIREEELRAKIEAVSTEEGLELLSRVLKVSSGAGKRDVCTEKVSITAEVMKDTADRLNNISDVAGIPIGEQIDRLCFNYHPQDAGLAAQMICESIVAHTSNLNDAQFDLAMYMVLSMFSKVSEKEEDKDAFARLVEDARSVLERKGVNLPEEESAE